MKISQVQPGQVFLRSHVNRLGERVTVAFVRIPDKPSDMQCGDCGSTVWNVNNFVCDVHFCINKDYDIEVSDWKTVKK